jgi:hypothetical protein
MRIIKKVAIIGLFPFILYGLIYDYYNRYVHTQYKESGYLGYQPDHIFNEQDIFDKMHAHDNIKKKFKCGSFLLSKESIQMIDNLYDFTVVGLHYHRNNLYIKKIDSSIYQKNKDLLHCLKNRVSEEKMKTCINFLSVQFIVTHNTTCLHLLKQIIKNSVRDGPLAGEAFDLLGKQYLYYLEKKRKETSHNIYEPDYIWTKKDVMKKIHTYNYLQQLPHRKYFTNNETKGSMLILYFQIINGLDFIKHDVFDWTQTEMTPFLDYKKINRKLNKEVKRYVYLKNEIFNDDQETIKKIVDLMYYLSTRYIVTHDPTCLDTLKKFSESENRKISYMATFLL